MQITKQNLEGLNTQLKWLFGWLTATNILSVKSTIADYE